MKIQEISRKDNTPMNFIYLPRKKLRALGWFKGDNLLVERGEKILILKKG